MKYKFSLFLWVFLQFSNCILLSVEHKELFNENLQVELIKMCDDEQELRKKWIYEKDEKAKLEFQQAVIDVDGYHLSRLKEIIHAFGWPGYSLVGPKGSHAFWLLVQHTPDYDFQVKCLALLEQAILNNNASKIDLAYLKDRVYVHAGKKQIYGTQLNEDLTFYPIEDEEHVNERREKIGLPSIEEYLKLVKDMFQDSIYKSK